MLAKDLMRRKVVCLTPAMSLRRALETFDQHSISGAPVLSPEGGLVGVLSRTDIPGHDLSQRVEQAMTPYVVSFEEETPARELARQMLAKRIHRVVITKDGAIRGIVTSLDLLKALLEERG